MNKEITLKELLKSRDDRREIQIQLIEKYHLPLISLTALSAGNIKRTQDSLFVGECATQQIQAEFGDEIVYMVKRDLPTGYEALYVINNDATNIKKRTINIEESHPLGRFMDIDVIQLDYTPFPRECLGFSPRKCVICSSNAHDCMRNRTHTIQEVNQVTNQAIINYLDLQNKKSKM